MLLWRHRVIIEIILKKAVSQAVVDSGGTISHQHGVGRDHAPYLHREKGQKGLQTLTALREHFDPNETLNPGVLLTHESSAQPDKN